MWGVLFEKKLSMLCPWPWQALFLYYLYFWYYSYSDFLFVLLFLLLVVFLALLFFHFSACGLWLWGVHLLVWHIIIINLLTIIIIMAWGLLCPARKHQTGKGVHSLIFKVEILCMWMFKSSKRRMIAYSLVLDRPVDRCECLSSWWFILHNCLSLAHCVGLLGLQSILEYQNQKNLKCLFNHTPCEMVFMAALIFVILAWWQWAVGCLCLVDMW